MKLLQSYLKLVCWNYFLMKSYGAVSWSSWLLSLQVKKLPLRLKVGSVITGFSIALDAQVKVACIFVASLGIISLNDSLLFRLPKVTRSQSFTLIKEGTLIWFSLVVRHFRPQAPSDCLSFSQSLFWNGFQFFLNATSRPKSFRSDSVWDGGGHVAGCDGGQSKEPVGGPCAGESTSFYFILLAAGSRWRIMWPCIYCRACRWVSKALWSNILLSSVTHCPLQSEASRCCTVGQQHCQHKRA